MLNNWIKGLNSEISCKVKRINIDTHEEGNHLEMLDEYKIVILSSEDQRPDGIRESLSHFENHFANLPIIDLGYFRKDDPTFNIQLIEELKSSRILPVILDKDFRWFSEIVKGVTKMKRAFNMCVSNTLQFSEYGLACDYMGFQRHLIEMDHIKRIADHSINSMSLGKLRADVNEVEPVLRDVDYLYFDISAIRQNDAPGSLSSMPSGLTCEEACQLMKYTGKSNNLKLLVIGGDYKEDSATNNCISEMLWYFLEGHSQKEEDHPKVSHEFSEYIVDVQELDESFTFIKNKASGRWWFSLNNDENEFISCSYNEYQKTIQDELPHRLLKHLTKI